VLLALCTTVLAHVGSAIYPIYELPSADLPDLHDGTLDDWEDVLPGASVTFSDLSAMDVGEGAPVDPGDLAYQVFLAWHGSSQRVYVAVESVDDIFVGGYEGGGAGDAWKYDGFEFLLDGDHNGGEYQGFMDMDLTMEERRRLSQREAQHYYAVPEAADDRILIVAQSFSQPYTTAERMQIASPPYADAGGFLLLGSPTISGIEMYVTPYDELDFSDPENSQRSTLYAEKTIGFQITSRLRCCSGGVPWLVQPVWGEHSLALRGQIRGRGAAALRGRGLRQCTRARVGGAD